MRAISKTVRCATGIAVAILAAGLMTLAGGCASPYGTAGASDYYEEYEYDAIPAAGPWWYGPSPYYYYPYYYRHEHHDHPGFRDRGSIARGEVPWARARVGRESHESAEAVHASGTVHGSGSGGHSEGGGGHAGGGGNRR